MVDFVVCAPRFCHPTAAPSPPPRPGEVSLTRLGKCTTITTKLGHVDGGGESVEMAAIRLMSLSGYWRLQSLVASPPPLCLVWPTQTCTRARTHTCTQGAYSVSELAIEWANE